MVELIFGRLNLDFGEYAERKKKGGRNYPFQSSATSTQLTGLIYEPFGPVTGWTYGNGLTRTKIYVEKRDGGIIRLNPNSVTSAQLTGLSYELFGPVTGLRIQLFDIAWKSEAQLYGENVHGDASSGMNKYLNIGTVISLCVAATAYYLDIAVFKLHPYRHSYFISMAGSIFLSWLPLALYREGHRRFGVFYVFCFIGV